MTEINLGFLAHLGADPGAIGPWLDEASGAMVDHIHRWLGGDRNALRGRTNAPGGRETGQRAFNFMDRFSAFRGAMGASATGLSPVVWARGVLRLGAVITLTAGLVFAGIGDAAAQSKKKRRQLLEQIQKNLALVTDAPDESWRQLDPENMVVMDLPTGQVVIEVRPDFAPINANRVKELVQAGFYDGLRFHRVIEGFVAQGGDPKNDGTGGSDKPNIQGEFTRSLAELDDYSVIGRDRVAAQVGYLDGLPVASQPASLTSFLADGTVNAWGIHCPGTLSMARATNPNSANSQFFFVIGDARLSLDSRYSVWGWVVDGFRHSRRIARGEPPTRPTPIVRARLGTDIPPAERPTVEIFRTSDPRFQQYLEATGKITDGLVRDICDIRVPVKVNGDLKL
ncbi:MAG: peptidylprolyl isomerase [Pseudomonadota bacterium]